MIVQLYAQSGGFVAEVDTPDASDMMLWGTRTFLRQEDGTYREATATPTDQVVSMPSQGYLGGIKTEDGF